jgi:inner membrane transporter RhtA
VRPYRPARRLAPAAVPVVLVLTQILSLQLGSAVAKSAYDELSPTTLAGLRLGFAALFLCLLARPRPRRLTGAQWRAALALGLVVAVMNVAYFRALEHLPLGVAATVELLGPVLLAVALSRRAAHLLPALLALAGVLLLTAPGTSLPLAGLLAAAVAAACRAGYVLANRRVGRLFGGWDGLAVALAAGACVLLPVTAATGGGPIAAHPALLGTGALVAVLSSLVPYALDLLALRRVDARTFGVLLALAPAVGALVGFTLLGERLTPGQLLAIALVVAGAAGAVRGGTESAPRPVLPCAAPAAAEPAAPPETCGYCGRELPPGVPRWTLRSRHATSAGYLEYCASPCGCLVVLRAGELVAAVPRR